MCRVTVDTGELVPAAVVGKLSEPGVSVMNEAAEPGAATDVLANADMTAELPVVAALTDVE